MQKTMEQPDKIFKNLFTKGFEDRKTGRKVVFPEAREKYAEYLLMRNWQDICGEHLAKYCCVDKVKGNELIIRAANSLLANELFMMKDLFLQKINSYLLGNVIIKKIHFQVGSQIKKAPQYNNDVDEEPSNIKYDRPCLKCGVIIQSDSKLCDVCAREEKNILKYKLAELLKVQPWLKYEACLECYNCDRILFNAVKDSLQNTYFEKVRLNTANENDCQMAVMFLTGKEPAEIDDKIYENSLTYLRRNRSVLTSGIGLHGKK